MTTLHIISNSVQFTDQLLDECKLHIKDITFNLIEGHIEVTTESQIANAIFTIRARQLGVPYKKVGDNLYVLSF